MQERTDLQEVVENLIRANEIKEEQREEAKGPISVLFQHMKILGWTLSDQLVITRKHGTKMHLTKGEDQLFDHWLREDLKRAIWSRDAAVRNREDLRGIAGTNIEYASTVQMMRAKKLREEKLQNLSKNPSVDEPGGQENQDSFLLSPNQRGCMRSILGGAVPTGERLFKAGLRRTALCPFCLKGEIETTKHLWWECTATEECRKDVKNEISQEDLDALPEVTKNCGIILDGPELDEWFSRLAGEGQEEEEEWPQQGEDDCSDFFRQWRVSQSCRRWSVPKRTRRLEAEILRSRSALWLRKQAQLCHTNSRCSTRSATCRNQSSFEMGPVGLEQNCLHHGLSAGQRRHRSDPSRQKAKAEIT